jgi:Transmembrane secretion effector
MSDGTDRSRWFLIIARLNYVLAMKKLSAASSSWTALRNSGFRAIWLASVISGICASAHATAATWAVNELSHSTLLLSMMSTRQVLFSLLAVTIPALLPVISLKELHINATELGLLYTSMGVGSVIHCVCSDLARRLIAPRLPSGSHHDSLCFCRLLIL